MRKLFDLEFWLDGLRYLTSDFLLGSAVFNTMVGSVLYYLFKFRSGTLPMTIMCFFFVWLAGAMYVDAKKDETGPTARFLSYWSHTAGFIMAIVTIYMASTIRHFIDYGFRYVPVPKWFYAAAAIWLLLALGGALRGRKHKDD